MKKHIYGLLVIVFLLCSGSVAAYDEIENKKSIKVAMFLPLHYDKIEQLDFTKYNIDEKKKFRFPSFEYISFYEGARLALDKLEREGYMVQLYVYDIAEEDVVGVKNVLRKEEMQDVDIIIPLLFSKCFSVIANFAKHNNILLINPMSQSDAILKNNRNVVKIQPDEIAQAHATIKCIENNFYSPNIIILYSRNKKPLLNYYMSLLEGKNLSWCGIDYDKLADRTFERIDSTKQNVYISIVDRANEKLNEVYANVLFSEFSRQEALPEITLFASHNWLKYNSINFEYLEKYNYHFAINYMNDSNNQNYQDFIEEYKYHFKQEPDKIYAAIAYDIMLYFIPAYDKKGKSLIDDMNCISRDDMISPYYFGRKNEADGCTNNRTTVYTMSNYELISVCR